MTFQSTAARNIPIRSKFCKDLVLSKSYWDDVSIVKTLKPSKTLTKMCQFVVFLEMYTFRVEVKS